MDLVLLAVLLKYQGDMNKNNSLLCHLPAINIMLLPTGKLQNQAIQNLLISKSSSV